jgi:hypothetical protein
LASSAAAKRTSSKGKGSTAWFNFGSSRTSKEVRATVLGLVRDLVKQQFSGPGAAGILDSCAEACDAHDISYPSLLQERSIENHTPIYWAIVKRPSEPPNPDYYDLITALLTRTAPLTPSTISDIRLACLLTSDQALFQRLRLSPAFSPVSGTDEMLLGESIQPDAIGVEDAEGDEGAFVANFEIPTFQKRMRVSNRIDLEFIARGRVYFYKDLIRNFTSGHSGWSGRMWCMSFCITPESQWAVRMAILENSAATWLDSRLIIEEASQRPAPVSAPPTSLIDAPDPDQPNGYTSSQANKIRSKPKPPISLRVKTGNNQLIPLVPHFRSANRGTSEILVALDDSPMGRSLQYE